MNVQIIAVIFFYVLFMVFITGCSSDKYIPKTFDLTKSCTPETINQFDDYIKKYAPDEDAFVAVQRIAGLYIKNCQWNIASEVFQKYRPLFPTVDDRFQKIINLLKADEEGLIVTNLGKGINTPEREYAPVPTADGTRIFFSGYERPDGIGGEDIFVSELKNNIWQNAVILGTICTSGNEAILSISADGNRITIFGNYPESLGRGDNFYVDKNKDGWGKIQHFPAPINSEYFDASAFITADGKAILFTSERPGGVGSFQSKEQPFHGNSWGNIDIYVCLKNDTGWSKPINLGSKINTPYCEYTPFLHPDGKTLYFSSDGHYGLGGLDVFKSVRSYDTSWTQWSEPVNLGKEINTAEDDWGFKISTNGNVAYFSASARNDSYGKSDIYSITLPKQVRPEAVATIRGIVMDRMKNPLEAEIKWEDLSTGKSVGLLKSNPQDGNYFIALPLGKNYGYYAEKKGYYPVSKNINIKDSTSAIDIIENIELISINEMKEKGVSVRINNIFFDYNKFDIKPESFPELDRLAKILISNMNEKVEIAGHTDNKGSEIYNLELSRKRAQAVVNYLISVGCNGKNIEANGYGESKPIASNATEEGRAANRRVEFKFVK
jgi:outer membrane protein OmpA-like peptidoglycan-associated protein